MSENTFRKKQYKCEKNPITMEEVNCENWTVDLNSCKRTCSLNLFDNPTVHDCISCKQRKSYSKEVLKKDVGYVNITVNSKPTITTQNVKNYVSAEMSQFVQGTVDDEIYNERKSKCMSCPSRVNDVNNQTDEVGWCTSCGCGVGTDRTKLSTKLRMPALFCPLGKFSSAVGKGFNVADAVDSIKGTIKVIKKAIQ